MLGKKGDSVTDSLSSGLVDVDAVASTVFHCWAQMPSINSMGCPGSSFIGFFVHQHSGAWRCQWGAVEVKGSKQLCMSGELGVDARHAQQVQGECCLMDEAAPEMEWKVWVSAGQTGNEVIFEGSDGPFSNDSAMVARWC